MTRISLPAGRAWRADLALIFIALVWGATFVVVKQALDDASALLFLALRFTLAALALGLVFRPISGKFAAGRPLVAGGILAGCCLFAGYVFQTIGLKYTTPSKSAFITGLSIVMVPLLVAVFERKAPLVSEWLGVSIATAGMGLLTLTGPALRIEKGDLLTLACATGFAAHIVVIGHYAPRFSFEALSITQIATAAALSLGTFWWVETPLLRLSPGVLVAVAITGLLATALAFAVQAWAQQYTTPTRTALIFALEPVFAWLTSFLMSGELLSARSSLGAVLILAGILLVELKPFSRGAHPPN